MCSVRRQSILIKCGIQRREETNYKYFLSTSPYNCNDTTLWNSEILLQQQFTTMRRCQKCQSRVYHAPYPANIFVTRILTRDLFAVANLLVSLLLHTVLKLFP